MHVVGTSSGLGAFCVFDSVSYVSCLAAPLQPDAFLVCMRNMWIYVYCLWVCLGFFMLCNSAML